MNNRRSFLKSTTLSICAAPWLGMPFSMLNHLFHGGPVVKQPGECEVVFVRENTPITFNLTKATDSITSVSLLSEELIPGSVIPMHKHLHEDEFFLFVQGSGSITINESTFEFKPGTTAFVPKDTWHSIKNTGNEKATFSFGYSPAGFEEFFRQVGTPKGQPFKPKSKEEIQRIANSFGMVFK